MTAPGAAGRLAAARWSGYAVAGGGPDMNTKIDDLMRRRVISVQPHHTVDHVRALFRRNRIHAVPVLSTDGQAVGIVSTADVADGVRGTKPVRNIMTTHVITVPQYNDVSAAARLMRNHKIHHVVVTHEQEVVGILSSFDLLRLVENHRFVSKNAPSPRRRGPKRA